MDQLTASVGRGGVNTPEDVRTVQALINAVPADGGGPAAPLAVDGLCGPLTIAAIEGFQRAALGFQWPDGRIDVDGRTWKGLLAATAVPTGTSDADAPSGSASVVGPLAGGGGGGGGTAAFAPSATTSLSGDQLASFIDVDRPGDYRGSIFFPTRGTSLDDRDKAELEKLERYRSLWRGLDSTGSPQVYPFHFLGFADHRRVRQGNDQIVNNLQLSHLRAESVRGYAEHVLGGPEGVVHRRYAPDQQACGVDARSTKDLPKAALALFRRVDLFAPPAVDNPEPAPKAPPKPTCTSNHWRARMLARSSIPIPSLPGEHGGRPGIGLAPEWFDVEIEDRDGRCGSKVFTFRAQGVGIGFSMNPTGDWADFDTSKQVGLGQFEGWAVHVAVQATVAGPLGSGSWDLLTMYGPQLWAGADPAVARWLSVAVHGFPGAEVTVSGGGLHP